MKCTVRVTRVSSGRFIAYCDDPKCSAGASTRQEALDKIKEELRYLLEFCPCSTLKEGELEIEVEGE